MKKIFLLIISLLLLFNIVYAIEENQMSYSIQLNYVQGKIDLNGVYVVPQQAPSRNIAYEQGHYLKIFDFDDNELFDTGFVMPQSIIEDYFDENGNIHGQVIDVNETLIPVQVPYFKQGKTIKFYDLQDKIMTEVDVSQFSDRCGDKICQKPYENNENCSSDCEKETSKLIDLTIKPKQEAVEKEKEVIETKEVTSENNPMQSALDLIIGIIIGVIVLIGVFKLAPFVLPEQENEEKKEMRKLHNLIMQKREKRK